MITNNTLFGTNGDHSDTPFSLKIEHHSELTQGVMCQIAHLHSTHFQIIDNLADDKKIYLQQGGIIFYF